MSEIDLHRHRVGESIEESLGHQHITGIAGVGGARDDRSVGDGGARSASCHQCALVEPCIGDEQVRGKGYREGTGRELRLGRGRRELAVVTTCSTDDQHQSKGNHRNTAHEDPPDLISILSDDSNRPRSARGWNFQSTARGAGGFPELLLLRLRIRCRIVVSPLVIGLQIICSRKLSSWSTRPPARCQSWNP